ncbi:MAG TPA: Uma2 family endonuclease [Tepidisphaeraceae bacterium]|jgi:Uma2 family endonuclease|nr:Uma2 family endonuclease [Tepidisphaeraceae bacterium]
MTLTAARTRRWTCSEFNRLASLGFFRRQRVELIGGRIVQMAPQLNLHSVVIGLAERASGAAFGPKFWFRPQLPLHLGKWSEPEPDIAVVPGDPRDYLATGHPRTALLIIEVSDTTLRYDRRTKAGLYAKRGIADYWIINLIDRQVEVHRDPIRDPSHLFRHRYSSIAILKAGETIQPLSAKTAVSVSDLLP